MRHVLLCSILMLAAGTVPADLLMQADTFDTDAEGWTTGALGTHYSTGGPAGVGDGYFEVGRNPDFPFHIALVNRLQWTGDYLASGVTGLEMDLNQTAGPDQVRVRLMVWGSGGLWASSGVTTVASGWNHYAFGLTASNLVFVNSDTDSPAGSGGGSGVLADTLAQVNAIQLRHDYAIPTPPGSHPEHIAAYLGVDNIAAVPEPATLGYLLTAGMALLLARRRYR